MKLFERIQHLVHKRPKAEPEIFLSLVLDEYYVQAGAWTLDDQKKPHMITAASERAPDPSWEDRIRMIDHAIGKLEEQTAPVKLSKAVLGLSEHFLTKQGDIETHIRPHLKQLTKALTLVPLGFVPLSTGIIHHLRKTEGIPVSVILINVTEKMFDIMMFRVGRLSHSLSVERSGKDGEDIENGLKGSSDSDVLPSRILLYGADDVRIQELKTVLLRYQWTAKANFLHYPKIELFPFDQIVVSVMEAGASEITHAVLDEKEEQDGSLSSAQQEPDVKEKLNKEDSSLPEEPVLVEKEDSGESHVVVVQPEALGFHETDETLKSNKQDNQKMSENPLQFEDAHASSFDDEYKKTESDYGKLDRIKSFKYKVIAAISLVQRRFQKVPILGIGIIVGIVMLGSIGFWFVTYYLPKAIVTIAVLPKTITQEETVTIDPDVASVDLDKKIIPAKKLEKVVSGQKTIPTTGKKKIGDPAKGTVTIFNKSETTAYTLKKGTAITTGSLQFTLDTDVSVASASTNLSQGQTVFGKVTSPVTAVAVGAEGNIGANKEFTIKEYANTVLVARNEQAFTGGTSKEISVVSRVDTDTLLKALTADLIDQAKTELAQSVSGKEQMIDSTVKTTVKEKQFVQEIDQEAQQLEGSLTLSVSAYTYNEEDIKSLLVGIVQDDVPSGYVINPGRTIVTIGDVTIAKNGIMKAKASLTSMVIPTIDETAIRNAIAGKKIDEVQEKLRIMEGVASAEFDFRSSWKKDALPTRIDHITINVSIVE